MIERIVVFSRRQIEELAYKPLLELEEVRVSTGPYAIISITGSDDDLAQLPLNADFVLRLTFDDILENMNGKEIDIIGGGTLKLKFITRDDALSITHFFEEIKDKVSLLVVHCGAGISRSAGVAIAIAEQVDISMMGHLISQHEFFNRDVYALIKQTFNSHKE